MEWFDQNKKLLWKLLYKILKSKKIIKVDILNNLKS